jgi:hypothetical protein
MVAPHFSTDYTVATGMAKAEILVRILGEKPCHEEVLKHARTIRSRHA